MKTRIELEDSELDYLMQVLATRPYGEVAPLIKKLMEQANTQPKPALKEVSGD